MHRTGDLTLVRHKFRSALSDVADAARLKVIWKDLYSGAAKASRLTLGSDELSLNDFALESGKKLEILASSIRNGKFQFKSLRPHLIPKTDGKDRLICVPTVDDRIVQRSILNLLAPKYQKTLANGFSFGFLRDHGVEKAARTALKMRAEHGWAFKTDISQFFDSLQRDDLSARIRHRIRERSLAPLLIAASRCEIETGLRRSTQEKINRLGIRFGEGLRQGMPLSPFFSNLYLIDFDKLVVQMGLHGVRYADDLIFFADSHEECKKIEAICRAELLKIELKVPEVAPGSKSVIVRPEEPVEFLGLELGWNSSSSAYELRLSKRQKEKIHENLLSMGNIAELNSRGIRLISLGQAIDSRIGGYLNAYRCCSNLLELSNDLAQIKEAITLSVLGPKGLGLDLNSLTNEKLTFVGLPR